jgi:pimeloyl-ACP methyl ester carboxylesterase
VDGLKLACQVGGQGDTALVFLHAWCGDHELWKHQINEFAQDYRVVTLDQAGHGKSGKNREHWSLKGLAEDVETVVKALGLKRVVLVGHSMSGPISLIAAKRMPDRVIAVIGVDTLQNAENLMPEETRKKIMEDWENDYKGTMSNVYGGMLPENANPELKRWLLAKAEACDHKMALELLQELFALDLKSPMKEAHVPVRCINSSGGYQFFTPTDVDTNRKYADYRAVFIKDVGHFPMLEKPAEFNQKLHDVLKEFAAK